MLPFTRRSFNWSAAALRCIVVSKRAFLKQWVEGWLTDRQGGRNNWIGMEGKAGPSTMSPLPSWQCQSSDEEEMSICSDFVTIMRCGCWIEQSHTYWNWTARYPFHSPSREFNHLHHPHSPSCIVREIEQSEYTVLTRLGLHVVCYHRIMFHISIIIFRQQLQPGGLFHYQYSHQV